MSFQEAIAACFMKYADFSGRASRAEYWWFFLFLCLASAALSLISEIVAGLFQIAVFLPTIAAGARRLHDTNRSGWLQLLVLIPVAGWIVIIVFLAAESKEPEQVTA